MRFSSENPGIKADILIHAIGFAPRECFDRPILFVEDEKINTAMTISANSLQRCLKFALPYLNPSSSTITLTYAASPFCPILRNHVHGKGSIGMLDERTLMSPWT